MHLSCLVVSWWTVVVGWLGLPAGSVPPPLLYVKNSSQPKGLPISKAHFAKKYLNCANSFYSKLCIRLLSKTSEKIMPIRQAKQKLCQKM